MKYGTTNIDQEDKEKTALRQQVKTLIEENTILKGEIKILSEICASARVSSVQPP